MKFRDPKTGEVFEDIKGAWQKYCDHHNCHYGCAIDTVVPGNRAEVCMAWCQAHPAEAARLMGYEVVEGIATGVVKGVKSLFCEQIGVDPGQPFIVDGYPYRNYPPMVYDEDGCVRLYAPDGQKRHKVGGRAISWIVDHPESVEPCKGYTPQEVAFKKEGPMEKMDKPHICEVLGVEVGERFTYPGMNCSFSVEPDGLRCRDVGYPFSWSHDTAAHMVEIINHPDRIIRKPRFTEEEVAALRHMASVGVVSIQKKSDTHLYWDATNMGGVMVVPPGFLPSLRPGQSVALTDIVGGEH